MSSVLTHMLGQNDSRAGMQSFNETATAFAHAISLHVTVLVANTAGVLV